MTDNPEIPVQAFDVDSAPEHVTGHEELIEGLATTWMDAYLALRDRIQADPQFMEVVRGYGGHPRSKVPTQRAKRVAIEVCKNLDLDPAIYLGNVFGAAADYIVKRSSPSDRWAFQAALATLGANDEEVKALADTDLDDVVDVDALAHERLASLRRVPSID